MPKSVEGRTRSETKSLPVSLSRIRFLNSTSFINYIKELFEDLELVPYTLDGEQAAETTAFGKTFRTSENMHSEMRALDYGLQGRYLKIRRDGSIVMPGGRTLGKRAYRTEQPHCRYCTFFLSLFRLPHSKPSAGLHKLSCHCAYPLPNKIKSNLDIIEKLMGKGRTDWERVTRQLTRKERPDQNDIKRIKEKFENNEDRLLDKFWAEVFQLINTAKIK